MEVSGQLYALAALPRGKNAGTHWIGGRVSPTAELDFWRTDKPLAPAGIRTWVVQPSSIQTHFN
jgi:hypothetical protein